ncbi:MAG: VanW family protein, partial [Clostridia bacterium]|nr:VanW family protein [Clostridia bacterium]
GRSGGWRGLPPKVRLALFALAALVVVSATAFGVVRLVSGVREASVERFLDNVSVNGIDMGGYTREEGYALMARVKDERLNTTYALTYGGSSWDFTPSDFDVKFDYEQEMALAWNLGHVGDRSDRRQVAANLKDAPAEFNSAITYDGKALDAFIDSVYEQIYVAPVDAEVAVTETKPVIITASQSGTALDKEKTRENLVALIETGKGDTALPVNEIQPAVTSDNMEMSVVAKFSTDVSFRGADSRANVRQALSFFNGYVVYPGDTCDFNAVVGPRTIGRGFKEAPEYAGNEKIKGVGGGVCQASTTLYDAVIMANMTILERHNHSMTVSYVEPSQDAAVEYGTNGSDGKNFVFRNDTEHAIYIYTDVDKENATVTIYGTRPEYHYELVSVIVDEQKSTRKRYEYDMKGKYVYYITDKPKLKTAGHGSCHSEGWLVAYDWDTKQEVSREQISFDSYVAGMNVYWRGVHDAAGNVVNPNAFEASGT